VSTGFLAASATTNETAFLIYKVVRSLGIVAFDNQAKLIVVDPRFTRSAAVSDLYVPIRAGSDIAWLGGLIDYLLTQDKIQHEYVKAYTNASFIMKAGFASRMVCSPAMTRKSASMTGRAGRMRLARRLRQD
jgi:anaerobic selenocysteine-containing dehydrogenase